MKKFKSKMAKNEEKNKKELNDQKSAFEQEKI